MALDSFFIPTDKDILRDLNEKSHSIHFIGLGEFSQKIDGIKFSRIFRYRFDKEKKLMQVIYHKQGLSWKFKHVVLLHKEIKSKFTL